MSDGEVLEQSLSSFRELKFMQDPGSDACENLSPPMYAIPKLDQLYADQQGNINSYRTPTSYSTRVICAIIRSAFEDRRVVLIFPSDSHLHRLNCQSHPYPLQHCPPSPATRAKYPEKTNVFTTDICALWQSRTSGILVPWIANPNRCSGGNLQVSLPSLRNKTWLFWMLILPILLD